MKQYTEDEIKSLAEKLSSDILKTVYDTGYTPIQDGGKAIEIIRKKVSNFLKELLK